MLFQCNGVESTNTIPYNTVDDVIRSGAGPVSLAIPEA